MNRSKLIVTVILFFCFPYRAVSQNLIPNGDFEFYTGCPTNNSQLDLAAPWFNPAPGPNGATPDYYNQCSTNVVASVPGTTGQYQPAHSGGGYAGIYLYSYYFSSPYREYIEVPLTNSLTSGDCYHFEMFVNLADICGFTTDDIHIYFSDTIIQNVHNYDVLPYQPQIRNSTGAYPDTLNWMTVSSDYTAHGGENYLIIGNFDNDSNTTLQFYQNLHPQYLYILIDDISLYKCNATSAIEEVNSGSLIYSGDNLLHYYTGESFLSIYDLSGKRIIASGVKGNGLIDCSRFNSGLYLYTITSGSKIQTGKFFKD
jgi:hypothetical protein